MQGRVGESRGGGMAKNQVWYVCPACRSRLAVERHHAGEIRCRNCSVLLRAAKESDPSTKKPTTAATSNEEEDEYRLAPLGDDQPAVRTPRRAADTPAPARGSELERLRARRDQVTDSESVEPLQPAAATSGVLKLDEELRDHQRYQSEPPPRWTFFSGVFTYPWRPQSILPWVILSIGIAFWAVSAHLVLSGIMSGTQIGVVMAGFLALGWIWLTILVGSYAAACVYAVTETTAYNFDAPYDWPEPDWRERFYHFLWLGWCLSLAVVVVVAPTSLVIQDMVVRTVVLAVGIVLLFPVFVLSTLESNSLWPLSMPIWRSLFNEAVAWITFYLLTGAILGVSGFASVAIYKQLGLLSVVILAPVWAACALIYARLLGRLAWCIMRPDELRMQAWRKAQQTNLAAEVRERLREERDRIRDQTTNSP